MRKIVYGMAVSMDGFMEGPDGETDWISYNPDDNPNEYLDRFDAFLIGRKSYEAMLRYGTSGNSFKGISCFVCSQSLMSINNGFHLLNGDIVSGVGDMKTETGKKDIALYGGAELASSLMNAGLVDEVVLSLQPVLIGSGKPMFQNLSGRIKLALLRINRNAAGAILHYNIVH